MSDAPKPVFLSYASPAFAKATAGRQDARRRQDYGGQASAAREVQR